MSVLLGTLTLKSPERSNVQRRVLRQAMRRSVGGQLYVYDKGVATHELDWQFAELTQAERDALQSFFDDVAQGMLQTFNLVDWYGRTWTEARFLEPTLEFTQTDEHRELGSGNGIYSVTLKMEAIEPVSEGGASGGS